MRRIENDSDARIVPFVQPSIALGARVRIDGSVEYWHYWSQVEPSGAR